MRPYVEGALIGFMIALWCFVSPWSDNTKYRQAIHDCERTLPRDQHCKVIGVPHVPK